MIGSKPASEQPAACLSFFDGPDARHPATGNSLLAIVPVNEFKMPTRIGSPPAERGSGRGVVVGSGDRGRMVAVRFPRPQHRRHDRPLGGLREAPVCPPSAVGRARRTGSTSSSRRTASETRMQGNAEEGGPRPNRRRGTTGASIKLAHRQCRAIDGLRFDFFDLVRSPSITAAASAGRSTGFFSNRLRDELDDPSVGPCRARRQIDRFRPTPG